MLTKLLDPFVAFIDFQTAKIHLHMQGVRGLYNIFMFGNYPVNDDWVFLWQVKAFDSGILKLSALLDPSFVSQGFLGLSWSKVFGLSYISLQVLTFLISLATCFFIYRIFLVLKLRKSYAVAGMLMLLFNPLFFVSSFTFMTDNYFLFFLAVSTYYFVSFLLNTSTKHLILGSLFALFAATTRQIGLLLYIPIIITLFKSFRKCQTKALVTRILIVGCFICLSLILVFLWPRFGVTKRFLDAKYILGRLQTLLYIPQYFIIFLSPIFVGIGLRLNSIKKRVGVVVLAFIFGYMLYKTDFFPLGNVLYIEELYTKSDFRSNFSLFDNVFTKLAFASIWGIAAAKIVFHFIIKLAAKRPPIKLSDLDAFLLISFALNLGLLLFSSDIYDRYLLPAFFFILLFIVNKLGTTTASTNRWGIYSTIGLLAAISLILQSEFATKNALMWKQLDKLRNETHLSTSIEFSDTYINHITIRESGDFSGLEPRKKSFDSVCFIQDYTLESTSMTVRFLENAASTVIANPKPPDTRKKTLPRIKNNLDQLLYNEEYRSIVYAAVTKKSFVGTFCKPSDE